MKANTCRHDKKEVLLYFYGELEAAASQDVELRLEICPSCREYYADLRSMESVIPRAPSVEPGEPVMSAVRAAISRRLREIPRGTVSARSPLPKILAPVWARWSVAALAVVLVFVSGRWSAGRSGTQTDEAPQARTIADISDLTYDRETGTINVQYQTVDATAVEGTLDDERVRALLTHALGESERPATRFRAVKILNDMDAGHIAPDPALVDALAGILREDSNDGMRLRAMRALRRIHGGSELSPDLTDLLMEILESSGNSALRIETLEMLTESELARQDLNRVLARAARDENSFIRNKARSTLSDLQGSVPLDQIQ